MAISTATAEQNDEEKQARINSKESHSVPFFVLPMWYLSLILQRSSEKFIETSELINGPFSRVKVDRELSGRSVIRCCHERMPYMPSIVCV